MPATAATIVEEPALAHVRPAPNRTRGPRHAVREDPVLDDLLKQAAGIAAEAAGSASAWAYAAEVGDRQGRRLREGQGDILDFTRLVYRLASVRSARAFVISAHVQSIAIQANLTMNDHDLVRRYFELTNHEELEADGEENAAVVRSSCEWDPDALERADLVESAVHAERAAVIRELKRRRINPLDWRREHGR